MKNRLWRAALTLAMLMAIPTPVSAHPNTDPSWNTSEQGWIAHSDGTTYTYRIPVCLDPLVGGPTWNTAGDARHARIQNAMNIWNNINGELFYWPTNSSCSTLHNTGHPFMQISKKDISQLGITDLPSTLCNEPWGLSCHKEVFVWYDSAGTNWWTGTSTPPAGYYDFESIILHEMGHTMTCSPHSPTTSDVMYSGMGPGVTKRILSSTDQLCYSHYYGTTH